MREQVNLTEFNPFPGLRPFSPEESDLFFGRAGQSKEVVKRLLENKFVTVIGASGSGKSSLIFCGVVPHLNTPGKKGEPVWSTLSFRPGIDPFGNLAEALAGNIDINPDNQKTRESVLEIIGNGRAGLCSIAENLNSSGTGNLLIIVDQFEEIFRYSKLGAGEKRKEDIASFIELIVDTTNDRNNNIFFILTMRSDFIGECAHHQGLTRHINDSNFLVPHMTPEDYREVITGPVKYAGVEIEEELVSVLLEEVGERTDQLPVLQHALMRTWAYWQRTGQFERPLSIGDYDSVGRMSGAMSRHADEAYEELSPDARAVCEVVFKAVTEKGSDNKGVRRPTNIKTIAAIAECSFDDLFEVVDKFRTPARSFITPGIDKPLTEESVIDLSHESLMRLWDRLKQWVDEEFASVQMYLRLSEASALYQRGKAGLWRPPDLQLAINWREKNKPTIKWAERYNPAFERAMVYLATSEKEYLSDEENKIRMQKRQLKRSRITAMILGVAAIISLGFMLFAFTKKLEADNQTMIAEEQKVIAVEKEAEALSNLQMATIEKQRADDEARIAREKEEEARIERDNAERQRIRAEVNAQLALQEQLRAEMNEEEAIAQRNLAEEKEQEAIAEREKAYGLRMLAVGKQMSVKSLQVAGQQDLQTLLAYQAYLFNNKYNGVPNDADIYSGLYNAVKNYGGKHYREFEGHNGEVTGIAFVPGKNEFLTSGQDGQVLKWVPDGNSESFQIIYSGDAAIDVISVSPDASWVACGDDDSVIRMIPLGNGGESFDLKGHTSQIRSLLFSYDGSFLYSAGLDGRVLKWDIAARTGRDIIDGSLRITSIDISSRNDFIAGVSEKGEVIVWDPDTKENIFSPDLGSRVISSIRFEPATSILAIGDRDGVIELWDVEKRVRISEVKSHNARVSAISFNPKYNQMATSSYDKTVRIWNRDDFTEPPITLSDNDDYVLTIEFSPAGDALVSATRTGSIISRAPHADILADNICLLVTRNLTPEEWSVYVGRDIEWEKTCLDKELRIKIEKR
jgi:WD40 repeat protein/energy-coupling factor transporter ATP-binding protein EcfA2